MSEDMYVCMYLCMYVCNISPLHQLIAMLYAFIYGGINEFINLCTVHMYVCVCMYAQYTP